MYKVVTTCFNWTDNPPPRSTWVWASYDSTLWDLVKTCKWGCCVHTQHGNMGLPYYWLEASPEEIANEEKRWEALPHIDWEDLYEGQ